MASTLVDKIMLMEEFKFLDDNMIYNMTARKILPHYKVGKGRNGKLLFDVKEVEQFFRSTKAETRSELKSKVLTNHIIGKRQ